MFPFGLSGLDPHFPGSQAQTLSYLDRCFSKIAEISSVSPIA